MKKIVRISTIPLSLKTFCGGLLRDLSSQYHVIAISSPGEMLDQLAIDEGIKTYPLPMKRAISPLSDMAAIFRLWRILRRERPDIVHSMTPKAGLIAMTAARLAGIPIRVHSFTGLLFPTVTGLRRRLFELSDRAICACATHILPEGQGVKADLQTICRKDMQVLGHGNLRGIDLQYYALTADMAEQGRALRRRMGIADDDFAYVYVGRIVVDKGIAEMVDAFDEVIKTRPDTHIIICGDFEESAPLSPTLRQRIITHPHIHLSGGWIDDVRPYYAAADALVLASYREGFPNSVLEGGAMGLPAIVTDINGSREIITDGVNGYIVPPRQSAPLAAAMLRLQSDPHSRTTMSRAAHANVAANYELSYVRSCLKSFYAQVLNSLGNRH